MACRRSRRGSAMIITMIVVVVLLLLSAGLLVFSANQSAANAAMRRHEQLSNCALAVRQYIGTQLRFPSAPTLQTVNFTVPTTGNPIQIVGGHYNVPTPNVTQFQVTGAAVGGTATTVEELGNNQRARPAGSALTGAATCTDSQGSQVEVEFSFSFGV